MDFRTTTTPFRPRISFIALPVLAVSCDSSKPIQRVEPTFIVVTTEEERGSETELIPFSSEEQTLTFTVETLDLNGDHEDFNGDLTVHVRPGRLKMSEWVTVENGSWTGEVTFEAPFGPTRFWFADEGDKDQDSGRSASWATGVSEPFSYAFPTIRELQYVDESEPDFTETNQLDGEYAEIQVEDRDVVVTALATNGFWVTDLDDGPGNHSGLFVYTFNKPEGVEAGSKITKLAGGNHEYLASSQISFPDYQADEETTLTPPDPVELTSDTMCSGDEASEAVMEALEGSMVEANNMVVSSLLETDEDEYNDYIEYGQWPIEFADGGCVFYVSSAVTVPGYSPLEHIGEPITAVRGMVVQLWTNWIITVLDDEDLETAGVNDDDTATDGASGPPPLPSGRAKPRTRDGFPLNVGPLPDIYGLRTNIDVDPQTSPHQH